MVLTVSFDLGLAKHWHVQSRDNVCSVCIIGAVQHPSQLRASNVEWIWGFPEWSPSTIITQLTAVFHFRSVTSYHRSGTIGYVASVVYNYSHTEHEHLRTRSIIGREAFNVECNVVTIFQRFAPPNNSGYEMVGLKSICSRYIYPEPWIGGNNLVQNLSIHFTAQARLMWAE